MRTSSVVPEAASPLIQSPGGPLVGKLDPKKSLWGRNGLGKFWMNFWIFFSEYSGILKVKSHPMFQRKII